MSTARSVWITVAMSMGLAASPAALAGEARKTSIGTAVTTLMIRDHVVVLAASTEGIRYSVATRDGRSLGADLSSAELTARFPAVFVLVRPSIAGSPESDEFIWAGL